MNILEVENLKTYFITDRGLVRPVRDVSFHVADGEIIGIVGESGSGKSVSMYSTLGLVAKNGYVTQGKVSFNGDTILHIPPREGEVSLDTLKKEKKQYEKVAQDLRGKEIGMIFQDPMTYLNPVLTIGYQMKEGLKRHFGWSDKKCTEHCIKMLELVGITNAKERLKQYPHELSGGMRQRILIAATLASNPKLLIADEPTTALDVTIQAQILDLIKQLKEELNMATILITHDLGVVASICSRILIMYGGEIIEEGTDREIFYEHRHPYTEGLLNSVASHDESNTDKKLKPIEGNPPDLLKLPVGCSFADRCRYAMKQCKQMPPPRYTLSDTHRCKCWRCHPDYSEGVSSTDG